MSRLLADLRDSLHGPFVRRLTSASEPVAIPVVVLEEHLRDRPKHQIGTSS